jgi:hypothetical protein
LPTKKETASERELLTKLDFMFRSSLDHPSWVSWRENAVQCFKYKEGEQWTTAELGELKDRGQPPTVNNQVKVTVDRVLGEFDKTRTKIGYRGRNPGDEPSGDTLSDIFLFVSQNNGLEYEEHDMVEDGVTGGFAAIENFITFDDEFQPEIGLRFQDPFELFPDPYSRRYDWNDDANFIARAKFVDVDEAKQRYPGKRAQIGSMMSENFLGLLSGVEGFKNENYVDADRQRIRLVEIYWKEKKRETVAVFADGTVVHETSMMMVSPDGSKVPIDKSQLKSLKGTAEHEILDKLTSVMHFAVFTGGILLDNKITKRKRFPWDPYFEHRRKSGEPYSLIWTALTLQDAINKRESKALHLLNMNQAIYEEGAVAEKVDLAYELHRPDGQVELRRGGFEKFELNKNTEVATTQFSMHQESKADFRRVTGVNPESLGEPSEIRSGVGIARKQAAGGLVLAPIFLNIRRTKQLVALSVLDLIQEYYTERRIFYITDDFGKSKTVALNAPGPDGEVVSVRQKKFDVIADFLPDTTTMQQEQYQLLATILPQILPFGKAWATLMVRASDLRNKDAVINEIEQMSQPPPIDPKFAVNLQWSDLDQTEKAAFALKLGMEALAKIEGEQGTPPRHIVEAQTEITKEQMRGQGDQVKIQGDMIKMAQELQQAAEVHEMDMEKLAMEIVKIAQQAAAAKEKTREKRNEE